MASNHKCGHCGSRDVQTLGHHVRCLICGGFTDSKGNPTDDGYSAA
jgi:hypothetical protein